MKSGHFRPFGTLPWLFIMIAHPSWHYGVLCCGPLVRPAHVVEGQNIEDPIIASPLPGSDPCHTSPGFASGMGKWLCGVGP